MKTFRILPFILLALGVAGCATTPKPEMTEQQSNRGQTPITAASLGMLTK